MRENLRAIRGPIRGLKRTGEPKPDHRTEELDSSGRTMVGKYRNEPLTQKPVVHQAEPLLQIIPEHRSDTPEKPIVEPEDSAETESREDLLKHEGLSSAYQLNGGDTSGYRKQPTDKGRSRQRDRYRGSHELDLSSGEITNIIDTSQSTPRPFEDIAPLQLEDIVNTRLLSPGVQASWQHRLDVLKANVEGQQTINGLLQEVRQFLEDNESYLKPSIDSPDKALPQAYVRDTIRRLLNHGDTNHAIDASRPDAESVRIYLSDALNKVLEPMPQWFDSEKASEDGVHILARVEQFRRQIDDSLSKLWSSQRYPTSRAA